MKRFYKTLTAAAIAAVVGSGIAGAQSKLSLDARMLADDAVGARVLPNAGGLSTDAIDEIPGVCVLIALQKGKSAQDLDVESLVVSKTYGSVVVATIDADKLYDLAASDAVLSIELDEEQQPDLMHLRGQYQTGITTVHRNLLGKTADQADAGLGRAFLGAGVITSLYDTGLDPNHIDFRIGDNYETSRVKAIYEYTNSSGDPYASYETPETVAAFTTEDEDEYHGTHVLGIMSGSYNGNGYYAEYRFPNADGVMTDSIQHADSQTKYSSYKNKAVPYYGVAPASDILVGCGPLYNSNMLDMAQRVAAYAKEHNQPAVINFSIGNTVGPKDGTSAFNKALAAVGEDIIISMSSSNDGDEPGWITKTFAASDRTVKTFFISSKTDGSLSSGSFQIWSNDATPFTATIFVYDAITGARTNLHSISSPTTRTARIISSNYSRTSTTVDYILNDTFDEAYNGYLSLSSSVMAQNNRYCLSGSFNSKFILANDNSGKSKILGIEIYGVENQTAYANAKVSYFTFGDKYNYTNTSGSSSTASPVGFTAGNSENSVNDLACGENVFVVGNYVNRSKFAVLNTLYSDRTGGSASGRVTSSAIPEDISSSSSYATLVDGRKLPHIAMPGTNIVSATSRYYIKANESTTSTTRSNKKYNTAVVDHEGEEYFWHSNSGTSMSSPAFAGSCALFLEADPTLKWEDINDVLKVTCRQDAFTQAKPERFGYGKVDVYAAVKEILKRSSVAPIYDVTDKVMVDVNNGNISVFVADSDSYTATVYNLNGIAVASAEGSSEVAISTSDLAKGVYVVNVRNGKFNKSTKVVVK